jgi:16S rRNA (uracil1498-N3)-methyltransferase
MRRIHVPSLKVGENMLSQSEAHHARHVLRLPEGATVELFDSAGQSAGATLHYPDAQRSIATVTSITSAAKAFRFTVASAVPKGDRADWMIEKLSELGAAEFIPLRTTRSVVHPQGKGKFDRWRRIAMESAKQCHRAGVMEIRELTAVEKVIAPGQWYLCTDPNSRPAKIAAGEVTRDHLTLLIGPEGDWTAEEIAMFNAGGMIAVSLGATILRVETAAIAAAVFAASIERVGG